MLNVIFPSLLKQTQTECNLSKSSVKNESDNRSYECFNHCMADLNNDELCRCNQNNELSKCFKWQ